MKKAHPERRSGQSLAALLVLPLAALPAALTATLVWCSLGRPLLFRQQRSGLAGRPFTLVKFRTMHCYRDADGQLLPDMSRATPLTRAIRRLRLDEFPQLVAIFQGEMNFVGPRPLLPATLAAFGALGHVRGSVRPGLTGWAQVNGNAGLSDREKLALDIWYVDHRSIWLDVHIMLLTAGIFLRGEHARAAALHSAQTHLAARTGEIVEDNQAFEGA